MNNFVVISGCSGGGKSTLLSELSRRGFPVIEEPGRRIVAEEMRGAGEALPWVNREAFARRAITLAKQDRVEAMRIAAPWVLFDRGLVDAFAALAEATGDGTVTDHLHRHERYHPTVFLAPPWEEIYCQDNERQHDFEVAKAEFKRLADLYPALGYSVVLLPKVSVKHRANFVLEKLTGIASSP